MISLAYQATEDDVANVLHSNSAIVASTAAKALEAIASEAFAKLDHARIEKAALYGSDLALQTHYANDEIACQLTTMGLLYSSGKAH